MTSTGIRSSQGFLAPFHHPAPELLVDYTSGALVPAEVLMIDLHLGFCAGCRRSVQVLTAAGGAMLDTLPSERLAPGLFNATLAALDRGIDEEPKQPTDAPPAFAAGWPRPLKRYVARHGLRDWRRLSGGFRALRIPFADPSCRVLVMKAPGGRGPFPHGHTRDEWTVVLEGGFTDESGAYNAGDFAVAGPGYHHTVVAEPGEGCLCVLLLRAAPDYTTWPGKLLSRFTKV